MNKRSAIRIIILLVLAICAIAYVWLRFFFVPDYPDDILYKTKTYSINPTTILTSLSQGSANVFTPAPQETEGRAQRWPPGYFAWNEKDYLKVASALNQFLWNAALEQGNPVREYFRINQCRDIFSRIDYASLSFYSPQEGVAHGFKIDLLTGIVDTGVEYSHNSGWMTTNWKSIDLDKIKINSVDAALLIAEEKGGSDVRSSVKNECRITLLLAPDGLEYDFLSHPFTHYGWGWSVIYWPEISNGNPLFEINIDPYSGTYK